MRFFFRELENREKKKKKFTIPIQTQMPIKQNTNIHQKHVRLLGGIS